MFTLARQLAAQTTTRVRQAVFGALGFFCPPFGGAGKKGMGEAAGWGRRTHNCSSAILCLWSVLPNNAACSERGTAWAAARPESNRPAASQAPAACPPGPTPARPAPDPPPPAGILTWYVIFVAIVAASGGLLFGYDLGVTGGRHSIYSRLK